MPKEFLKRFLPMPFRHTQAHNEYMRSQIDCILALVAENRELSARIESLRETVDSLDRRILEVSDQTNGLAADRRAFEDNMEKGKREALSRLDALEAQTLRSTPQPRLGLVEVAILDHCNLNCRGCFHFAPLAKERIIPLENIQSDLRRLSSLTAGRLTRLRIMGGEPLLHPDLLEILRTARGCFPRTVVSVLSNGVLLPTRKQGFWDVCRENDITVEVTKYPIDVDYDNVEKTADANRVDLVWFGDTPSESQRLCINTSWTLTGFRIPGKGLPIAIAPMFARIWRRERFIFAR